MLRDAVEVLRGQEAGDGREVAVLEELEQRVAVVRIDDHARLGRLGGVHRQRRGHADQRGAGAPRYRADQSLNAHHYYCQTLTSNSGCSLPVESLMRSSMSFSFMP